VHQAGLADFTALNRVAHTDEVCVEAPVESNLQLNACGLDRGERGIDLAKIKGNGLLAENVLAGLGGLDNQFRVRTRRGADKHRSMAGFARFHPPNRSPWNAAVGGERLRGLTIDVGYRENFGFRQAERKRLSMHTANAAAPMSPNEFVSTLCPRTKQLNLTSY